MALNLGQDLAVIGNIKLTDVELVAGAYRTLPSSSATASLTDQRLEDGQLFYIQSEHRLLKLTKYTDDSFNVIKEYNDFAWPSASYAATASYALNGGGGGGGSPTAISGAFAAPSGGFSTRVSSLETTMVAEQTNIDNLQTVQGSQAADIVTLEGRVNQSVKTDASPTFVAVNTGQGANELYAMNQNVRTADSPTFAGMTATGNVVVEGLLIAKEYIVSSSVTHMTQSFSSGSTIFGDTIDDTHQFTGSLLIGSGSISGSHQSTASFGMYGNNLIVKADSAAELLSVFDSSNTVVFEVNNNKTLKLAAVTGSQPSSEAGGIMYSGSQWFFGTE